MSSRSRYKKSRVSRLGSNIKSPNIKATKESTKSQTFKDTLKLVKQVNSRITKLNQHGYASGTWASKKLNTRLQTSKIGAWHRGRVKVKESMSETQLKAIQKASRQFLASKTSTYKGINKVKKNTIKSLASTLSDEDRGKVNSEDAEFYYDMLGEDDFDYFSDKIGASTLWSLIDDSIEYNDSKDGWLNRLGNYITLNDEDVRNRAIRLYNKYIGGSSSVFESRGKRYQDFAKNFG